MSHAASARRCAFTLIELLVVIAVIMILASLVMPAADRAMGQAQKAHCTSNLHQCDLALKQYGINNNRFYPGALLVEDYPGATPTSDGPWNSAYLYFVGSGPHGLVKQLLGNDLQGGYLPDRDVLFSPAFLAGRDIEGGWPMNVLGYDIYQIGFFYLGRRTPVPNTPAPPIVKKMDQRKPALMGDVYFFIEDSKGSGWLRSHPDGVHVLMTTGDVQWHSASKLRLRYQWPEHSHWAGQTYYW